MNRQNIVYLLILLGVIAVALFAFSKTTPAVQIEPSIPVRVQMIGGDHPTEQLQISGTTKSSETAELRFQVSGRIVEKSVKLGDTIKKGDILAKIYNPELEPIAQRANDNLARVTSEAQQSQRDFKRVNDLFKQQAVTRQEWEQARTRLNSAKKSQAAAQSESNRAKQVSSELELIAPFAGRVTDVLIDVGEAVSVGTAAVRISNPDAVELRLPIGDRVIQQLAVGQTVQVSRALNPSASLVEGTIIEISPFREKGSLPEVVIALEAQLIGPGEAVNAFISIQSNSGISLPIKSVIMTGEHTVAVYKVIESKATLVAIRPMRVAANEVIVDQAVAAGDFVVIEGIANLYDGATVEVLQ